MLPLCFVWVVRSGVISTVDSPCAKEIEDELSVRSQQKKTADIFYGIRRRLQTPGGNKVAPRERTDDAIKNILTSGTFPDSTSLPILLKFLASGVACSLTLRPCSIEFLSAEESKIHQAISDRTSKKKGLKKQLERGLRKKKRIDGSQTAAEFEVCFRVGMIHVPTNAALNSLTQLKSHIRT